METKTVEMQREDRNLVVNNLLEEGLFEYSVKI
jgi:hypothetical protein